MQAYVKNDGQRESVNRSEIMGAVNPIVLSHRVRVEGRGGTQHIQFCL